jgi:hypothetical protein
MLQGLKFNSNIQKVQDVFSNDSDRSLENNLIETSKSFNSSLISKKLTGKKEKGIEAYNLFNAILLLIFMDILSISGMFRSKKKGIVAYGKDSYYRHQNNENINWRFIHYEYVKTFIKKVKENSDSSSINLPSCLICDDTTIEKAGSTMEGISRVFDHSTHRHVLGYKGLFLNYFDGKSIIPLDFSLHCEQADNEEHPYGLTAEELKNRYNSCTAEKSYGGKRKSELGIDKISNMIEMIKQTIKQGIEADYLLLDSWFVCEKVLQSVKISGNGKMDVLGIWKINKQKVEYDGVEYSIKSLIARFERKHSAFSKTYKSRYIELIVKYKGHEVKLFIVNYKNSNHQQILLTTNTKLNFNQAMKIYAIRWSIEVFFKEAKQHLGLGKCQSQNFNAQIANTTITCIRFIMLALRKRFSAHETIGGLFKDSQAEMLEMIVADKILKIIIDLLKKISQLQNLTIDKAIELLYQNPQLAKLLEMASNFGEKNKSNNKKFVFGNWI